MTVSKARPKLMCIPPGQLLKHWSLSPWAVSGVDRRLVDLLLRTNLITLDQCDYIATHWRIDSIVWHALVARSSHWSSAFRREHLRTSVSTEVCGNALTIWSFGQTNTVAPLDSTTTTIETFTPQSFGGRTKMYKKGLHLAPISILCWTQHLKPYTITQWKQYLQDLLKCCVAWWCVSVMYHRKAHIIKQLRKCWHTTVNQACT